MLPGLPHLHRRRRAATPSARDRPYIEQAVAEAKRRNPTVNASIFDFLRDVLLLRQPGPPGSRGPAAERRHFAMRFQQITGPVMAKGVEDTAFYVYNRLVVAERGRRRSRRASASSPAAFHDKNARAPGALAARPVATATHDTKRGEDVRARINVLSEMPDDWAAEVRPLARTSPAASRRDVDGRAAPDRNDEYLLYQTLLGAWPAAATTDESPRRSAERLRAYMQKATKEAKVTRAGSTRTPRTTAATRGFVDAACSRRRGGRSSRTSGRSRRLVAALGAVNSLAQTLLKLTRPGVPDFYQGTELWDCRWSIPTTAGRSTSPAARRCSTPCAPASRRSAEAPDLTPCARELLEHWPDGRVKLYLTHRALTLRRPRRAALRRGRYRGLAPGGSRGRARGGARAAGRSPTR